jgi:hypothetical protein
MKQKSDAGGYERSVTVAVIVYGNRSADRKKPPIVREITRRVQSAFRGKLKIDN